MMQGELNARIETVFFNRKTEQSLTGRWFWVGKAGELPGSPYVCPDGSEAHDVRAFTTDRNLVALVEDQIEKRGLQKEYEHALLKVLNLHDSTYIRTTSSDYQAFEFCVGELFPVLRATPEQRCLAALRAVGVSI